MRIPLNSIPYLHSQTDPVHSTPLHPFHSLVTALLLLSLPLLPSLSISQILNTFTSHLLHPETPNRFLLGLKALRAVDPGLWTMREEGEWGEGVWRGVVRGLDHEDEGVRKEVSCVSRAMRATS